MTVTKPVSATTYGVVPNQVVSKSAEPTTTTSVTQATKGGKKRTQHGGITTVQGNPTPTPYKSHSYPSPSQTSTMNQQTTAQANVNGSGDNGANNSNWRQTPALSPGSSGGSRRKSRKSRKSRKTRKSRKSRKHKRRNTHKK